MIPLWAISGLAAAALAGVAGWKACGYAKDAQIERERAGWAEERAQAAVRYADAAASAIKAEQRERDKEKLWSDVARSIDNDGNAQAEKLRATAGRADAAVVGLRAQLGAVVADAARAAEAGASAADARQRQAAAEATGVLAELLGQCHDSSRARALYADRAATAGARCERWGDAIAEPAASAP